MEPLKLFFEHEGFKVYCITYASTKHPLQYFFESVGEALKTLPHDEVSKLHILTHSMGGVILRGALEYFTPQSLGHIVMLSPPNKGSEIVDRFRKFQWFGRLFGPAALQLSTDSTLLKQLPIPKAPLGIIAATRSSVLFTPFIFMSANDGRVAVKRMRMAGMDDFVTLKTGHIAMLFNRDVAKEALYFMRHGFFKGRYCSHRSGMMGRVLRWKLSKNPKKAIKQKDRWKQPVVQTPDALIQSEDFICWLGHASFLIQINGKRIITDPIFTAPPTYKRLSASPYTLESLGAIDYVLISHAHYDHLDLPSIKQLAKQGMKFLVPDGIEVLLKKALKEIDVEAKGWFESYETEGITITLTPAKHWSRRGVGDLNRELWGGFFIQSDHYRLFFAGDTGYDTHFEAIYHRLGAPDIALMPIGAYEPSYMMQGSHLNPQEAYQGAKHLHAACMVPMHYGTFDLADEPISEPRMKIEAIAKEATLPIRVIEVGEVQRLRDMV